MRVYLIRHTRVAVEEGLCYGRTDVGLHDDWPEDLERLRGKLPTETIAEGNLYSSPLTRCHTLASRLGSRARTSDLLREMDFGDWEGRQWGSIARDEIDAWLGDLAGFRTPGGESLGDVSRRSRRFLEWIQGHGHDDAFVVTHGGVVRCLVAHALGLPLQNAVRIHVDFGGVSVLRLEGETVRLEGLNL